MCNPSAINPVWVAVTLLSMEPVTSHSGFQALPLLLIKSYSQVFRMVKIYIHTSVSRLHSLLDIYFFFTKQRRILTTRSIALSNLAISMPLLKTE